MLLISAGIGLFLACMFGSFMGEREAYGQVRPGTARAWMVACQCFLLLLFLVIFAIGII